MALKENNIYIYKYCTAVAFRCIEHEYLPTLPTSHFNNLHSLKTNKHVIVNCSFMCTRRLLHYITITCIELQHRKQAETPHIITSTN